MDSRRIRISSKLSSSSSINGSLLLSTISLTRRSKNSPTSTGPPLFDISETIMSYLAVCKSQYKNVGLGQYKNVGFPTFLYCLFSLHLL